MMKAEILSIGSRHSTSVLDSFGVPSATFDKEARCIGVSRAASDLLGGALAPALDSAASLVAEIVADRFADWMRCPARHAPAVGGRVMLRAQRLPPDARPGHTIVVFLPRYDDGALVERGGWGLTPREAEVAGQIALGASNKVIAQRLGISLHTARRHTERVFAKLGVRSRAQLVLLLSRGSGDVSAVG